MDGEFTMSMEQKYLEEIELCSKRMQNLIMSYCIQVCDPYRFPYALVHLESIAQEAADEITKIDKQTGQVSPGEHIAEMAAK